LNHGFRGLFHHGEGPGRVEQLTSWQPGNRLFVIVGSLLFSVLFHVSPQPTVSLPSSVIPLSNPSYRDSKYCALLTSSVLLNPIKLMIKVNHHRHFYNLPSFLLTLKNFYMPLVSELKYLVLIRYLMHAIKLVFDIIINGRKKSLFISNVILKCGR
jgi:hypothetical protein